MSLKKRSYKTLDLTEQVYSRDSYDSDRLSHVTAGVPHGWNLGLNQRGHQTGLLGG